MKTINFARIEFLQDSYGNSKGEIVKVVHETDGEVYYYDGDRRYCFFRKSEENLYYRYIPKGERVKKVRR